ncbi:hypothetical protein PRIPAC_70480 [Pristionchus pacificus]|uniref:Uncharacterized protein n=1 Tax=Pristionchus pacificus TaxID=54126 RepID=A0A2A6BRM5_PRIPA|nr:hypothetical protein PRIPAC_70480 [Pristionchus pacificus]|eukprot:PDM68476.1 hypothetical protein PRIPAC_43978 [Pristionchus pacificus]
MRFEYFLLLPLSFFLIFCSLWILHLEMSPFGLKDTLNMMRRWKEAEVIWSTTASSGGTSTASSTTASTTTTMKQRGRNRCPPGGVWSEWVTTGPCPTTCGGCSQAPRVRTCTKQCGECPCEGPSRDIGPCGLALCPFPSQLGTCCLPLKKSLNYEARQFLCGAGNVQANQSTTNINVFRDPSYVFRQTDNITSRVVSSIIHSLSLSTLTGMIV